MKIDESRSERQRIGAEKAKRDLAICGKACLNYFTGFGKTYTTFTYFIKPMLEKYPTYSVLILVPTKKLKTQWELKIEPEYLNKIRVECWHSVYNQDKKSLKHQMLIIDEIHEILKTDRYINVFKVVDNLWLLGLSATFDSGHEQMLNHYKIPISDKITEKEGLANGWLSEYNEFNYKIQLSLEESKKLKTIEWAEMMDRMFLNPEIEELGDEVINTPYSVVNEALLKHTVGFYLKNGNKIHFKKEDFFKFKNVYKGQIEVFKTGKNKGKERHIYHYENAERLAKLRGCEVFTIIRKVANIRYLLDKRSDFIYNHFTKLRVTKEIIEKFPDRKGFVFSTRSEFCDNLSAKLPEICRSVHSNIKTVFVETVDKKGKVKLKKLSAEKQAALTFEEFRNEKSPIRILASVKQLEAGIDESNVSLAIMTSYFSKETRKTQQKGRVLRKEGDKKSVIINLCLFLHNSYGKQNKTIEHHWLMKNQKGSSIKPVWVESVDEILEILNKEEKEGYV